MFYRFCHKERRESHLNVTGVNFLRLQIWKEISQLKPSEIHYQPSPTAQNGSLDM